MFIIYDTVGMNASQTNPALNKAIALLQFIADSKAPVTVKELSYSLGIPPASCYRMVRSLARQNWLTEEPSGGLRIGFGLAHVARSYSEVEARLRELERPLQRLADELDMSVKITLREGNGATTALRAESARQHSITNPIGYHFHLAIGSAGGALLAQLEDGEIERLLQSASEEVWKRQTREDVWRRVRDCRASGACSDLGQHHPSVYAASIPLRLTQNRIAALTAVGWPEDFQRGPEAIIRALRKAAASMEV